MTKRKRKAARRQPPRPIRLETSRTPLVVCRTTGLSRRDAIAATIAGRMMAGPRPRYYDYDDLAQRVYEAADKLIYWGGE